MSRKQANRLFKSYGIGSAKVYFTSTPNSGEWIHPEIFLHEQRELPGDSEPLLARIRFQAHRLDGTSVGHRGPSAGEKPDDRFDFGPVPYSACYGARFEEGGNYRFGSLKAPLCRAVGDDLRKLARLIDTLDRTVKEYNLAHLAPNCELTLWVEALTKLGVSVEIVRRVGDQTLDQHGWRHDLPENQRHPARDLYERIANGAGNGGKP